MYLLYGGKPTRSLLVEMVMAEGDIEYTERFVDIGRDQHRSAGFLALNPAGWVPALVTPAGEVLYETPAINLFLCERHGLTQLAPTPDDPLRARFLCSFAYLAGELEPALKRYWYPQEFGEGEADTAAIERIALRHVRERCEVIDARLAEDGPFHLGERYSLADLTLAYWMFSIDETGLREALPAVRECCARVAERERLALLFERLREDW